MERKFIPLSVPNFPGNEVKYVSEAVASTWVSTAGPLIPKFEKAMAEYMGVTERCVRDRLKEAKDIFWIRNGTIGKFEND